MENISQNGREIILVLFPVLQLLDYLTTVVGVSLGLKELNPFVVHVFDNYGWLGFLVAKAFVVGGILVVLSHAWPCLVPISLLTLIAVINNFIQIISTLLE